MDSHSNPGHRFRDGRHGWRRYVGGVGVGGGGRIVARLRIKDFI